MTANDRVLCHNLMISLNRYFSNMVVLKLCTQTTFTIIDPNLIKVDDRLLSCKLCALLISSYEMVVGFNTNTKAVSRENGAYFVNCDNDNLKKNYLYDHIVQSYYKME